MTYSVLRRLSSGAEAHSTLRLSTGAEAHSALRLSTGLAIAALKVRSNNIVTANAPATGLRRGRSLR